MIDLRLGRYQDVLADVECDALIVDAPYSERTHSGHDTAAESTERFTATDERRLRVDNRTGAVYAVGVNRRKTINYPPWTPEHVAECVRFFADRTRGWFVTITDHTLAVAWADELADAGRYVFSPLPLVEIGSRVRLTGDGPSSWTCWIVVARPRALSRWGTRPGAYVVKGRGDRIVMGGKDSDVMKAIVRDYSLEGDLVCDPCAGGGTTLFAAESENRRAVGAEVQIDQYDAAQARIAGGVPLSLFTE